MSARVYIGGLSDDCRTRDLEDRFRNFGEIRDAVVKNHYGFVVRDLFGVAFWPTTRFSIGMRC